MSDPAYIIYTERTKTLPAKYYVTLHHQTFRSSGLRDAWLEVIANAPLLETLDLKAEALDSEPVYLNMASDKDIEAAAEEGPEPLVIGTPPSETGCTFLILNAAEELACLRLVVPDWDKTMSKDEGRSYCELFHTYFDGFAPFRGEIIRQFQAA